MDTDTRQYLADRGFVTDEGRIARNTLVQRLRQLVPTIDSVEDVERGAALVTDLREQVLGASGNDDLDRELNYLVGDLLSVAPNGKMQDALENGYVLCAVRVKRTLVEGEDPVSKSARFISGDPDVVERYSQQPAVDRAVKAASNANKVVEMTGRRLPVLATRRVTLVRKAQEQLALALPLDES